MNAFQAMSAALQTSAGLGARPGENGASVFEKCPIALWRVDASGPRAYSQELLKRSGGQIRAYLDEHPEEVAVCGMLMKVTDINRAALELFELPDKQRFESYFPMLMAGQSDVTKEQIIAAASGEQHFSRDARIKTFAGRDKWIALSWSVPPPDQRTWSDELISFVDITARKAVEQQLVQSQKLEAVGLLAGGVAHDFNNLLTGIDGYSQLAGEHFPPDHPGRADLQEISALSRRAAGLTRQLLTFARRQTLQPVVLDLNEVTRGVVKLLRRLIGEHIQLDFRPSQTLDLVRADPSQVEQVLVNLAVNARDAMADGGLLVVETANRTVSPSPDGAFHGVPPGDYVVLEVADTGCGMDAETQERLFEPFFTTKPSGRGTGLGLPIVYGIVRQHGGYIAVDSRPGHGARFTVYLPRVERQRAPVSGEAPAAARTEGTETILVVEDEPTVRELIARVLSRQGYRVLTADCADQAVQQMARHGRRVHLLLTDVVMPGRNGRELYESMSNYYPHLRVLYMSGYAHNAVSNAGLIAPDIQLVPKPFSPETIASKVREVLDLPRPSTRAAGSSQSKGGDPDGQTSDHGS